jgi:hypothetical protein
MENIIQLQLLSGRTAFLIIPKAITEEEVKKVHEIIDASVKPPKMWVYSPGSVELNPFDTRNAADEIIADPKTSRHTAQQLQKTCEVCGKIFDKKYTMSKKNFAATRACSRKCGVKLVSKRKDSQEVVTEKGVQRKNPFNNMHPQEEAPLDVEYLICQNISCRRKGRFVAGTGVTYEDFAFCSPNCREEFKEKHAGKKQL